jgi:hypothetical protein
MSRWGNGLFKQSRPTRFVWVEQQKEHRTMIKLGQKVIDRITGFTGTVTGKCEYISGCSQVLVAPRVGDDGAFKDSQWFDQQRLVPDATDTDLITLDNGPTPGADKPAPRR